MAAASPEEAARLRAQLAEVKRQLDDAAWRVELAGAFSVDNLFSLSLTPTLTYEQKLIMEARDSIKRMEKTYLPWALAGRRTDGSIYDRAHFTLELRDTAKRIKDASGAAWNESIFQAVANIPHDTVTTAKQVVTDAQEALAPYIPDPETGDRLIFWLKVAAGVAGGAATLGFAAYVVRSFR